MRNCYAATYVGWAMASEDLVRNRYAMVDPKTVQPSGYNPNQLSDHDKAQLLDEIRHQERLLKPVVCRKVGDQLIIVDGEHNWRAALEAGLAEIPVELIDVHTDADYSIHACHVESFGEFEARRQTYVRNLAGNWHNVPLGRMFVEMLNTQVVASNRDLAAWLAISEGTVRNMILYSTAARLCAGRDDCPDEDAIAQMGIRAVRNLIARLEGLADEGDSDQPTAAVHEARILARLKRAWAKATEDERREFLAWTGATADIQQLVQEAYKRGRADGRSTIRRSTNEQPEPEPAPEPIKEPKTYLELARYAKQKGWSTPKPKDERLRNSYTDRGARIRQARIARKLNQGQLGDLAGVHRQQVSMAESAKLTPSGGPAAGQPAFAKLEAALGLQTQQ